MDDLKLILKNYGVTRYTFRGIKGKEPDNFKLPK